MKTKRILLVLAVVMLMVSLFPLCVSKAATNPTISVDSINNAKVGDTVTVNVKLDKDIDIATISAELSFDSAKLEVTDIKIGENLNIAGFIPMNTTDAVEANKNNCIVLSTTSYINGKLKAGNLATVTFKIKNDVSGKQNLNLELKTLASSPDGASINNIKDTAKVVSGTINVVVPINSITLNGNKPATLKVGETTTLTATVAPNNATESKTVTWTSSDNKVASVENGLIKAIAPGTATITAKAGEKTATYTVKVVSPLTGIKLNSNKVDLLKGQTATLKVTYTPENTTDSKDVTWSSSNTSVATIKDGIVTAIKAGEAIITAKVGNFTATCNVKVEEKPLNSIILNEKLDFELKLGTSKDLKVIYNPADTTDSKEVIWSSSKPEVATVKDGKVTALKNGETTITAKVGNFTTSIKVTVPEVLIEDIKVSLENEKIEVEKTTNVIVVTEPELVTENVNVIYSSKDEKIAKVDENGVITGIKSGTTTITVEVNKKFKKEVKIEVTEKVIEKPTPEEDNSGVPVTGDIAIGAFVVLTVISLTGIVLIVVKKLKK